MSKKLKKLMKLVIMDGKKSSYLLKELRNFDEIFRKKVAYDNIKNQRKARVLSFSRRDALLENNRGNQIDPPAFLRLRIRILRTF